MPCAVSIESDKRRSGIMPDSPVKWKYSCSFGKKVTLVYVVSLRFVGNAYHVLVRRIILLIYPGFTYRSGH